MGPVVEVRAITATLAHERIEVEDAAVVTLRFASGALGVIEATTAVYPGYLKRIEIHGTTGSAALEEEDIKTWDFAKPRTEDQAIRDAMAQPKSTAGGASDPTAIGHHCHAKQFQDFVDAIRKRRRPAIDGREGRRSVEIILGIYKSAESGKAIALPLKSDPALVGRGKQSRKR
jgi:UDP-N-acetyl-2-amino-2-deoxyglucuronate dehydrogenase